ncbi:MAG: HAD hydrolase family protein [Thermovirgaceae bacterium]|nr:HAD hydrolase family protein [Thermovirgaceae bacterium]
MRKLLVTDIDGTLAHGDHIPDGVVMACDALRAGSWDIAVATGRILASARRHISAVGAVPQAILYDGARIMHSGTGKEIWGEKLAPRAVEEILGTALSSSADIQVFGNETVLCRKGDCLAGKYFASLGVPVDDSLDRPMPLEGVYRIILHGDPREMELLGERISIALDGMARAVLAGSGFLDILAPGVSKGAALQNLLGSMPDNERYMVVAAAGDHMNDLELLRSADIAVTMSDAPPPLLEIADIVLPSASEQGFSRILAPLENALGAYVSRFGKRNPARVGGGVA